MARLVGASTGSDTGIDEEPRTAGCSTSITVAWALDVREPG